MAGTLDREWLARRSDAISWAIVLVHLALVLSTVLVAAAIGPSPWILVAWLWFGLTFTGPLNLMHECAHRLAFRRRGSSDFLGRRILGPLALADFDAYRERHWAHHRNLGLDGDTKDAYLVDLRGAGILRLLLRCLSLREAVRKFTKQTQSGGEELPLGKGLGPRHAMGQTVVVQALLLAAVLAVAAVTHHGVARVLASAAFAYGFVYLYGLATLTVFAATLRAVAEHQAGNDDAISEGRATLRNFRAGPLTRLVFGSYGFSSHATHHREPGVAHYRLAEYTRGLEAGEPGLTAASGYLSTLWSLGAGQARRHRRRGISERVAS
jgi:fatty acid desaturase